MSRLTVQPQIIVEEEEDDESEDEDIATPLRPTDTFPLRRRNSPYLVKPLLGTEDVVLAPSPTPSIISIMSRHDFSNYRISDEIMTGMIPISTIHERSKGCRTGKYVYTPTMANYTVAEYTMDNGEDEKITNTLEILCQLRHRRVARTYGYHWKPNQLFIFRTHVPNGTIADRLKTSSLSEELALKYTSQALDALVYLHDRKIIHGKLNASNLLLTLSNDILLSDPYIEGVPKSQKRRALLSSPPEAFRTYDSFPCLTTASDVWAIGCLLVAMITRFCPFSDHFLHFHGEKLHFELVKEWTTQRCLKFTSDNLLPAKTSKDICDLVDQIFTLVPERRPTASFLHEVFGPKSRKTSMRTSLTSMRRESRKENPIIQITSSDNIIENDKIEVDDKIEKLRQTYEKHVQHSNGEGFAAFFRWYLSRFIIFSILLIKWVGMVLCAGISLGLVAGSVFLAILFIYNGIQFVCQCQLNEGFIVLIALILLPIIILLTTLCCNNSLEKYNNDVESGKVENSRFVMRTPEKDVILCGYIVIEGKPRESNERKHGITEGMAQMMNHRDFLSGVAKIA